MTQDPLTLYKLIVLYMLNRVNFPMTKAQIGDFILEHEYTNFLTLQQVISELIDANMITAQSIRNRTHLSITKDGKDTLEFFKNRISTTLKEGTPAPSFLFHPRTEGSYFLSQAKQTNIMINHYSERKERYGNHYV